MNDIVINKIQSIQRCIKRARQEYDYDTASFENDFTRQDAALLNVLRACEQSMDLANHIISSHRLGVPTTSSESFDLLHQHGIIDEPLTEQLKKMVKFRNILVHQYQRANIDFVRTAIEQGLDDLIRFGDCILQFEK